MIIVINDKKVQDHLVRGVEQESDDFLVIPWPAIWGVVLGMWLAVIIVYWSMFSKVRSKKVKDNEQASNQESEDKSGTSPSSKEDMG